MFWVALADIVPEQGAMRFLTGSHREGPLGTHGVLGTGASDDALTVYPGLLDLYELSPPLNYRAGDATVHHCLTRAARFVRREVRVSSSGKRGSVALLLVPVGLMLDSVCGRRAQPRSSRSGSDL
jgi:hypothetical protein